MKSELGNISHKADVPKYSLTAPKKVPASIMLTRSTPVAVATASQVDTSVTELVRVEPVVMPDYHVTRGTVPDNYLYVHKVLQVMLCP